MCKSNLRRAIATLYSIIFLLVIAMSMLAIASLVNSSILGWLAAWVWVSAAFVLVMSAWALFDNIQPLKPRIVKSCLPSHCDAQRFNRYFILFDLYKRHHGFVVLPALGVAFATSFIPNTGSMFSGIAMLSIGPLIANASWMIGDLRAILRCWK